MEKTHSSLLSFFFPWLSPLVITFTIVPGGIEVQLSRKDQQLKDWRILKQHRILPEPLLRWIEHHHIFSGPQPYPLIKQLWQNLHPLASEKLIIDASALAELREVNQPSDFTLVWALNPALARIEGHYEGIEHYLGMGWFQKGLHVWPLHNITSQTTYTQFEELVVPLQDVDALVNTRLPQLQRYLPTRLQFHYITDFRPQITVPVIQNGRLTFALHCNYPQLRPNFQIPQQHVDVLLAPQTIIRYPRKALTPILTHLLQNTSPITIQGINVLLFIREQLPIFRQYQQISNELATKITASNPIVPIATLKPSFSFKHIYEHGIGKYTTRAIYQYQGRPLDIDVLLAAYNQTQRFVQQHGIWFEWPIDARAIFATMQQHRTAQVLRPEEIMGFSRRQVALLDKPPDIPTIQPVGPTLADRAQSLFAQLRHHGIPGGIIGEPKGLATMFIEACKSVLHANQQVRILWLVPSNKKGSVTRALNASNISSYITVASPVTLQNEPTLISRTWHMVIFHELDQLLHSTIQPQTFSQLTWIWAILSVTSQASASPSLMRVLHLPEQYHKPFWMHYLFDLEKKGNDAGVKQQEAPPKPVQPAPPPASIKPKPVETVAPAIASTSSRQQKETSGSPTPIASSASKNAAPLQQSQQRPATPDTIKSAAPLPAPQPIIQLNMAAVSKLQEESDHLRERLILGTEEERMPAITIPLPVPVTPAAPVTPDTTADPGMEGTTASLPEVDEDWKIIIQQWQVEHWGILTSIYQEQQTQLSIIVSQAHRPLSQLIDELNLPVDEQLGDLLIDPDTQTIAQHLRATAENLVHWHLSTKGR